MKTIQVYDLADTTDLKAWEQQAKFGLMEAVMEFLDHVTASDLFTAACSNKHFADLLNNLAQLADNCLRELAATKEE